jgi:glycosyltransferase involved in cell wall biosynthesis
MEKREPEGKIDLSVVIPVFEEEKSLPELHTRLTKVIDQLSSHYELIFIDDGSKDGSSELLKDISRQDPRVTVIHLRRNFGKTIALSTGFKEAQGEKIITLDADLQDLPEEIPNLLAELDKGYDLISGWKNKRKDPLGKKINSWIFNHMVSFFTGVKIHDINCGLKAYRKKVIEEIELYGELHRFIPALASWKGFKVGETKVEHHPRKYGKSKYGTEKYLRGIFDLLTVILLTKYTQKPLHFFGLSGVILFFAGAFIDLYLAILWFSGQWISNRPLLLFGTLLVIVGIQFIFFGLLGELIVFSSRKDDDGKIKEKTTHL